jgi:hypothetical protein
MVAVDHAYDPAWSELGDDGGHFGPLSREFARQVLQPLLWPQTELISR